MLVADGGGAGGTNWSAMSVIDMWLAIGNQDTTNHWELVNGWRKSYELILQHKGQVEQYRDSLATAWPPEKSPAAAAYKQRLDELITHLQGTYDAAVANHSAFSGATLALTMARTDLEKVVNEYVANQQKLADFEANPPERPVGSRYLPPLPKPPVADGRQRQLELQAQSIMYGLSSEISQASGQITRPATYKPFKGQDEKGDSDNPSSFVPPTIPGVVPFDPSASSDGESRSGGSSGTSSGAGPSIVAGSNSGGATSPSTPSTIRQPGLVLGGVQPAAIAPVPSVTGITPPSPVTGISPPPVFGGTPVSPIRANQPSAGTNLPRTPGGLPGNNVMPGRATPGAANGVTPGRGTIGAVNGATPGRGTVGGGLRRIGPSGLPAGGLRAMPPGGVIGGSPGMGLGQPMAGSRGAGQATSGGRPSARVNPVGGMINPSSASERANAGASRPMSNGQPLPNLAGRNAVRSGDDAESRRWDPDNPWETAEGVAPVVLPCAEQRVDPGPAIGLH